MTLSWNIANSGDWNTAGNWTSGTVPNSPTADVEIDAPVLASTYTVTIATGESELVNSLTLNSTNNADGVLADPYSGAILQINGTLTFALGSTGAIDGPLQSSIIVDNGTIANAGTINAFVQAVDNVLFSGANAIYFANWLQAQGVVTIDTSLIGQIVGTTLSDGIFETAGPGAAINFGGEGGNLTVNIATVEGAVAPDHSTELIFRGPGSSINEWTGIAYQSVEASITTIGVLGTVDVLEGRDYTTTNALTVDAGLFNLQAGTVSIAGGLSIMDGGIVQGSGIIASDVVNDATLVSGQVALDAAIAPGSPAPTGLTLLGALSGIGNVTFSDATATLELGAVTAGETITMLGGNILTLDTPISFLGTIVAHVNDQIDLTGIAADSAVLIGSDLVVSDGGVTVDTLQLAGSYSGDVFDVVQSAGNSFITVNPVTTVTGLAASGVGITDGDGDLTTDATVALALTFSAVVNVDISGGVPTLTLSDGAVATYVGGTGTNTLTFNYVVGAGDTAPDLSITAFNLNSGTVQDGASNDADTSGAIGNPPGTLQIDTTAPTVTGVAASGSNVTLGNGDLTVGQTVTLTLTMSEAVTVDTTGGSPTLTLNDGGIATYVGGTGTSVLMFTYTVGTGETAADLTITAFNPSGATVQDAAGNDAATAGAIVSPPGTLQIDTMAPTVTGVAASGTDVTSGNGDLTVGQTVTLTLTMSEVVTIAGDNTPTLTLNSGGVATYASGSGSNTLMFTYVVGAEQTASDLAITAFNSSGATVLDGAGNIANTVGAVGSPAGRLQIDTSAPGGAGVSAAGTGVTAGSGDLTTGATVTLALVLNEAVIVSGDGTPTLTLNSGGVATYVSGSGSSTLTFTYTVGTGQTASDLAVTAVNLNGATVRDAAGNFANTAGAIGSPPGTLQIDTTAPLVTAALADNPRNAGGIVYNQILVGGGDPNTAVTITEGGQTVGTAQSDGTGAWSFDPSGLSPSTHTLVASETDGAGNTGSTGEEPVTVPDARFDLTNVTNTASGSLVGSDYTGPVSYLQAQYIYSGSDNVILSARVPNVFIHGGSGEDALAVTAGSNVLDGGGGSNWLVGASGADGGTDTFFVDGRAGQPVWDTLLNFHAGDMLTFWGYNSASGSIGWADNQGAAGYQGATLVANLGNGSSGPSLVTFAGLSTANAQFSTITGTSGGTDFLLVTRVA